jgi:hypothetical protein
VDPGLHHLQGKAELVKPAELLSLLQSFHRDKLALYRGHEAGARRVSGYEFNNTYQYVLARESAHLDWLRAAVNDLGGAADESATPATAGSPAKGADAARAALKDDAAQAGAFLAAWRPRIAEVSNARHRRMLELIAGEVAEHQRFFEQAAAGRLDLLGRRPAEVGTGGGVMAARWIE